MNKIFENGDKDFGRLTPEVLKKMEQAETKKTNLIADLTETFLRALQLHLRLRKKCFKEIFEGIKKDRIPIEIAKIAWKIALDAKYNRRSGWRTRMQNIFGEITVA